jgi:hypothetical protein
MMLKKDKSLLNTFLKKNIFKENFALSIFQTSKETNFLFIKKKDILINKLFYIFKTKNIKSFNITLNTNDIDLSKFFLIKHTKTIFFDAFLFKKNNIKIYFNLLNKSSIINYNYYLNNFKN